MLKILAAVKENFTLSLPGPPWARFCDPGVPDHLETPQSGQMDSKMEVYVEINFTDSAVPGFRSGFISYFLPWVQMVQGSISYFSNYFQGYFL